MVTRRGEIDAGFSQADRVRALKLKGLYEVREPSRFYPAGESAAHLIGMVGLDNQGLLGLERLFDAWKRPGIRIRRGSGENHGIGSSPLQGKIPRR